MSIGKHSVKPNSECLRGLLELRPSIDLENGTFTLVAESGNDRKSSGSYYTPSELVDHLITTTIDPLIEEAKEKAAQAVDSDEEYRDEVEKEILKLTVCDPACGSGTQLTCCCTGTYCDGTCSE